MRPAIIVLATFMAISASVAQASNWSMAAAACVPGDPAIQNNLHFITAFLDRYVKDDASRAAYLDGMTRESVQGEWPASAGLGYDAVSPGADGITVWKGFQRGHAEGLELLHEIPR